MATTRTPTSDTPSGVRPEEGDPDAMPPLVEQDPLAPDSEARGDPQEDSPDTGDSTATPTPTTEELQAEIATLTQDRDRLGRESRTHQSLSETRLSERNREQRKALGLEERLAIAKAGGYEPEGTDEELADARADKRAREAVAQDPVPLSEEARKQQEEGNRTFLQDLAKKHNLPADIDFGLELLTAGDTSGWVERLIESVVSAVETRTQTSRNGDRARLERNRIPGQGGGSKPDITTVSGLTKALANGSFVPKDQDAFDSAWASAREEAL